MDKKASAYRILWDTLIRLPYIALLFIIFVYMYSNLVNTAVDSNKINDQIIMNRLLYSPNALAYRDPNTMRVYPGIIDLMKADQEKLDKAFLLPKEDSIAARIELKTLLGTDIIELYVNEDWYNRWSPLTSFDQYDKQIFKRPVLIMSDEGIFPGVIRIDVVSPNG